MSYYITSAIYANGGAHTWYSDDAEFEPGKGWKLQRVWRKPPTEYDSWSIRPGDIIFVTGPCTVQRIEQPAPWTLPLKERPQSTHPEKAEKPPGDYATDTGGAAVIGKPMKRGQQRPEGWTNWPS